MCSVPRGNFDQQFASVASVIPLPSTESVQNYPIVIRAKVFSVPTDHLARASIPRQQ
jgi:hypothetical protein